MAEMDWSMFCDGVKKAANKVAIKAADVADVAVSAVKVKGNEILLCEEYEKLGRLTYAKIVYGKENADQIAKVMDRIAQLIEKINAGKSSLNAEQEEQNEEKASENESVAE